MSLRNRGLFFLIVLAIFFCAGEVRAGEERVVHVIDGDTFIIDGGTRVRMIGIDAPEVENRKWGRRAEPFGKEASRFLRNRIEGQKVILREGSEPEDRYGRKLAYVYLEDGSFVNREMVEAGWAVTYRRFPFQFREEFLDLERAAMESKTGMWQDKKNFGQRLRALWSAIHQKRVEK